MFYTDHSCLKITPDAMKQKSGQGQGAHLWCPVMGQMHIIQQLCLWLCPSTQYWNIALEWLPYVKYRKSPNASCRPSWIVGSSKILHVHHWSPIGNVHRPYCPSPLPHTERWLWNGPNILEMGNPLSCHLSGILDQKFKMRLCASMGHSRLMFMYKHVQLRSFTHEIWLRKGLHMLSIENPVISRWSAILD